MTVDDLIVYGKSKVHSELAKMLLADLLGVNSLELLLMLDKVIDEDIIEAYKYRVSELRKGRPIQYIIGNVNFCGNTIDVDENVLIPRFETEELVINTIKYIKKLWDRLDLSIIDLGCGSGAIGLTLKKELEKCDVNLLDISREALDVAKKNADKLGLDVNFIENDMLENITDKYDVIISNPPYIKDSEEIEDIVKNNEPHLALYGGRDGLDYYRKIFKNIDNNLNEKYLIALEIGDSMKEDIYSLASNYLSNFEFVCLKDNSNRDRMIFIFPKC